MGNGCGWGAVAAATQPVVRGSLPRTFCCAQSEDARSTWQAARRNRLAAWAPHNSPDVRDEKICVYLCESVAKELL
jgi:hypothetical protein